MNNKHWSDGVKGRVAMIGGIAYVAGQLSTATSELIEENRRAMIEELMIEQAQRERFGVLVPMPAEEFIGYLVFPPYVQSQNKNGVTHLQKRDRNKPSKRPFLQVRTVANNRKCKVDLKDWIRYGRA